MDTKIQEARVPSIEDIRVRHLKKFSDSLREAVDSGSAGQWISFIEELEQNGYPAREVAAALCAKIDGKNKRLASVKNIRRVEITPEEIDHTWLNIDIGSKDKVDANFILGAIVEATNLPTKAIGKIFVFRDYINIEMMPEEANMVIKKMKNSKIRQRTVHFTLASKSRQQICERMLKERKHGSSRSSNSHGNPRGGKPYNKRRSFEK